MIGKMKGKESNNCLPNLKIWSKVIIDDVQFGFSKMRRTVWNFVSGYYQFMLQTKKSDI